MTLTRSINSVQKIWRGKLFPAPFCATCGQQSNREEWKSFSCVFFSLLRFADKGSASNSLSLGTVYSNELWQQTTAIERKSAREFYNFCLLRIYLAAEIQFMTSSERGKEDSKEIAVNHVSSSLSKSRLEICKPECWLKQEEGRLKSNCMPKYLNQCLSRREIHFNLKCK